MSKVILLFSGKRKSGKDFLTEHLLKTLGSDRCEIVRISEPIKSHWAREQNLDLKELLSDGPYKELYRKKMIEWSEEQRARDYGIFCREAMLQGRSRPICIVSDIRRKTDLQWFAENHPDSIRRIRVKCSDATRTARGWVFETGVDDAESECNLDDISDWDVVIDNDQGGGTTAEELLKPILDLVADI